VDCIFVTGFIDDEASEDGLHGDAVDCHEDHCDGVGGDKDQDEQIDGLLHVGFDVGYECNQ
jgi:hypothetical protein